MEKIFMWFIFYCSRLVLTVCTSSREKILIGGGKVFKKFLEFLSEFELCVSFVIIVLTMFLHAYEYVTGVQKEVLLVRSQ